MRHLQKSIFHALYNMESHEGEKDNMIELSGPREASDMFAQDGMNEERLTFNIKVSKEGDASRKETREK